jgi:hypothetical protein
MTQFINVSIETTSTSKHLVTTPCIPARSALVGQLYSLACTVSRSCSTIVIFYNNDFQSTPCAGAVQTGVPARRCPSNGCTCTPWCGMRTAARCQSLSAMSSTPSTSSLVRSNIPLHFRLVICFEMCLKTRHQRPRRHCRCACVSGSRPAFMLLTALWSSAVASALCCRCRIVTVTAPAGCLSAGSHESLRSGGLRLHVNCSLQFARNSDADLSFASGRDCACCSL